MAPELRKRKAPQPAPEPPAKKPAKSKVAKAAEKVKEAVTGKPAKDAPKTKTNGSAAAAPAPVDAPAPAASAGGKPVVGEIINLEGFGGEIETNDGTKTTLKALVDESKAGVVLFTYPKASTPGCKILLFSPVSLLVTHVVYIASSVTPLPRIAILARFHNP
jgi:peroxiredoxin Q/BCP